MSSSSSSSRERKPNTIYSNESYLGDECDVKNAIRKYQKGFSTVGQRKRSLDGSSRVAVGDQSKGDLDGVETQTEKGKSKMTKKARVVEDEKPVAVGVPSKEMFAPVMSHQQQIQDEIEEKHIARGREEKLALKRLAKPKKTLPEGPNEVSDLEAAIKRGVRECSTLLVDWSSVPAKAIGSLCKVYWDGEDSWFYARVLNYDCHYRRYFIYYLADSTVEWISFEDEIVLLAEEMVLARLNPGALGWPAQRFWISGKAHGLCNSIPGFHKGGHYVEYLSDSPSKEYAFLQKKCLEPLTPFSPPAAQAKKPASFKRSMRAAEQERETADRVIKGVMNCIRDSAHSGLHGDQWVGLRVRSSPNRTADGAQAGELQGLGSVGTIAAYCPSSFEHLLVFDEEYLQPRWLVCQKGSVEVLLGEREGAAAEEEESSSPTTTVVPSIGGHSSESQMDSNCTLCHGFNLRLSKGQSKAINSSLKHCYNCNLTVHPYCIPNLTYSPTSLTPINQRRGGNSSISSAPPPLLQCSSSMWACWKCTACFGCGVSAWEQSLLDWNTKHVDMDGQHWEIMVCADCLYKYKRTSEFCPLCFKFYPTEDSSALLQLPPPLNNASIDSAISSMATTIEHHGDESSPGITAVEEIVEIPVMTTASSSGPTDQKTDLNDEHMVQCNECARWVHAQCEGIDYNQYNAMTHGTHPIWGDEYLCPLCRVKLSKSIIKELQAKDINNMFANPVTLDLAPNYRIIIKSPMDISTMLSKAQRGLYKSLQALRQDVELMCLNAIVFNKSGDEYWREAVKFNAEAQQLFDSQTRKTHLSAHGVDLQDRIGRHGNHPNRSTVSESEVTGGPKKKGRAHVNEEASEPPKGSMEASEQSLPVLGSIDDLLKPCQVVNQPQGGAAMPPEDGTVFVAPGELTGCVEGSSSSSSSSSSRRKVGFKEEAASASSKLQPLSTEANVESELKHDNLMSPIDSSSKAMDDEADLDMEMTLPSQLSANKEPLSYIPCTVVVQTIEDAYFLMFQDACLVCGSAGRPDMMLFCVDCGEAIHSFCADAPIGNMCVDSRLMWRCMNCKLCEICQSNVEELQSGKLVYCEGCDEAFHLNCLRPVLPMIPKSSWFCMKCVHCKECQSVDESVSPNPSVWGYTLNQCYPCFTIQEKRIIEKQVIEQRENLLKLERLKFTNCNICCTPCETKYVLCMNCGRHSHISCNSHLCLPLVIEDLHAQVDFFCLVCTINYIPSQTSHVGAAPEAAALLMYVSHIQRMRLEQKHVYRLSQLQSMDEYISANNQVYRPLLHTIILWAGNRMIWLNTTPTAAISALSVTLNSTHPEFILNRSTRFLAYFRGLKSKHEGSTLEALDRDCWAMSADKLVRIATIASAFIETTSELFTLLQQSNEESISIVKLLVNLCRGDNTIGGLISHLGDRHTAAADYPNPDLGDDAMSAIIEFVKLLRVSLLKPSIGIECPLTFMRNLVPFKLALSEEDHPLSGMFTGVCGLNWFPGKILHNNLVTPSSFIGDGGDTSNLYILENGDRLVINDPEALANIVAYMSTSLSQNKSNSVVGEEYSGTNPPNGASVSSQHKKGHNKRLFDHGKPKDIEHFASVDLCSGDGFYARKAQLQIIRVRVDSGTHAVTTPPFTVEKMLKHPCHVAVRRAVEGAQQLLVPELVDADSDAVRVFDLHVQEVQQYLTKIEVQQYPNQIEVQQCPTEIVVTGITDASSSSSSSDDALIIVDALTIDALHEVPSTEADSTTESILDTSAIQQSATSVLPLKGWIQENCVDRLWEDPRRCTMCFHADENELLGRLLPFNDGSFVHVNCLRFSSDVTELRGTLRNASVAREKALKQSCSFCGLKGATLHCFHGRRCKRTFHLHCAVACNCALFEARSIAYPADREHEVFTMTLCPEHMVSLTENREMELRNLWVPYDPLRCMLMEENLDTSDCKNASEVLAQHKANKAVRSGAVTIFSIGTPVTNNPSFYNKEYIYPHRFRSTRIFWSMHRPLSRTLYCFEVFRPSDFELLDASKQTYIRQMLQHSDKEWTKQNSTINESTSLNSHSDTADRPVFRVVAMDSSSNPLFTHSIQQALFFIRSAVLECNRSAWVSSTSKQFAARKQFDDVYGMSPHQFFGLALPFVRRAIEEIPECLSLMVSFAKDDPKVLYEPVFKLPTRKDAVILRKKMVTRESTSINGCARADGYDMIEKRLVGRKITRMLTKLTGDSSSPSGDNRVGSNLLGKDESTRDLQVLRLRYEEMSRGYLKDPYAKVDVRKSAIHGWGLFAKINFESNDIIVEYIGQKIRQVVADRREVSYEEEGVGSCYLFRLDDDEIVDATRRGGMARFMNHCCEPNAKARVLSTADGEKHIVIMADRDIQEGEEITYNYQFQPEESKLKCYCGAPRCAGYMN